MPTRAHPQSRAVGTRTRTSHHVNVNFNGIGITISSATLSKTIATSYSYYSAWHIDVDEHSKEEGSSMHAGEIEDAPSRSCACCSMACSRNLSSLFWVASPAESRCPRKENGVETTKGHGFFLKPSKNAVWKRCRNVLKPAVEWAARIGSWPPSAGSAPSAPARRCTASAAPWTAPQTACWRAPCSAREQQERWIWWVTLWSTYFAFVARVYGRIRR